MQEIYIYLYTKVIYFVYMDAHKMKTEKIEKRWIYNFFNAKPVLKNSTWSILYIYIHTHQALFCLKLVYS